MNLPTWPKARRRSEAPTEPLNRAALLGALVDVALQDLAVTCRICNATVNTDGRLRVEVTPAAGSGFQWIEARRVIRADSPVVAAALGLS